MHVYKNLPFSFHSSVQPLYSDEQLVLAAIPLNSSLNCGYREQLWEGDAFPFRQNLRVIQRRWGNLKYWKCFAACLILPYHEPFRISFHGAAISYVCFVLFMFTARISFTSCKVSIQVSMDGTASRTQHYKCIYTCRSQFHFPLISLIYVRTVSLS